MTNEEIETAVQVLFDAEWQQDAHDMMAGADERKALIAEHMRSLVSKVYEEAINTRPAYQPASTDGGSASLDIGFRAGFDAGAGEYARRIRALADSSVKGEK